jgi:hypothetical protein
MKKILFLTLIFSALTYIGHAQHDTKAGPKKDNKETPKPATPPNDPKSTPKGDESVIYLGTNEFFIALEREGILKG